MIRKSLSWLVLLTLVVAWLLVLRPTALGGPATYVLVSGESMEPTLSQGDLVVLREQASYAAGDLVTFPVPEGEPGGGSLVIHRIVGGEADAYTLKGDNNERVDDWTPSSGDVRGAYWFHVPAAGTYIAKLSNPPVLAAVLGGLVTVLVLLRRDEKDEGDAADDEQSSSETKELEHA